MRDLQKTSELPIVWDFYPLKLTRHPKPYLRPIDEVVHRFVEMYAYRGTDVWFSLRIHVVDQKAVYPEVRLNLSVNFYDVNNLLLNKISNVVNLVFDVFGLMFA